AFAGVLASAAFIASLAATLAFAGVFASAAMGIAFFFFVSENAGGSAIALGLGGGRRLDESAAEEASECGAGEEGLGRGIAFHVH
ncbi:MAG: hypothetical protein JWL90_4610, partial [Chthoniobacteraceae bacterium]|nr:hypothetical protein [Chthoniobacteraceae bacterium]